MDAIERAFHVSPDGGSGATELLYAAVAVAVFVALGIVAVVRARYRAER